MVVLEIIVLSTLLSIEPVGVCAAAPLMRRWLDQAGFEQQAAVSPVEHGREIVLFRDRAPPHEVWVIAGTPGKQARWCVLTRRSADPA
jgi:hypothetical protein